MLLRNIFLKSSVVLAFTCLFSCVTINIYFPAEEVQKAAERIVSDIRKQEHQGETSPVPKEEGDQTLWTPPFRLAFSVPDACAQQETKVSNPAIRGLKDRIKARRSTLVNYLSKGIIRENDRGFVDVVNPGSLDMKTRSEVQRLVGAENQDRRQLYLEVARALNHEVDRVGRIFADEWQR